jgi:hypothetical protein
MSASKDIMSASNVFFRMAALMALTSSTLALLGCSGGGGGSGGATSYAPKGEASHIAIAGNHITKYVGDHNGKVPKDTGEMKDWAAKNNIPEDDLVSSRDKEPYQVREVSKGQQMKQVIVFETTGANGKKFMYARGPGGPPAGSEVTQEDLDNALKSSGGGPRGRP